MRNKDKMLFAFLVPSFVCGIKEEDILTKRTNSLCSTTAAIEISNESEETHWKPVMGKLNKHEFCSSLLEEKLWF